MIEEDAVTFRADAIVIARSCAELPTAPVKVMSPAPAVRPRLTPPSSDPPKEMFPDVVNTELALRVVAIPVLTRIDSDVNVVGIKPRPESLLRSNELARAMKSSPVIWPLSSIVETPGVAIVPLTIVRFSIKSPASDVKSPVTVIGALAKVAFRVRLFPKVADEKPPAFEINVMPAAPVAVKTMFEPFTTNVSVKLKDAWVTLADHVVVLPDPLRVMEPGLCSLSAGPPELDVLQKR